ncbi:MAG: hypothetical protein HQL78_07830 [Magnetococcales bacterium]|nr:hypothetical protein [Magnetococcales bacterium]
MTNDAIKNKYRKHVLIVDLEASGLHDDSYPTEVGWINPIVDGEPTSFLIKPSERWLKTKWDKEAEKLTGITRELLINEGHSIHDVAINLKRILDSSEVILSDAPEWDRHWMQVLFNTSRLGFIAAPLTEFHSFVKKEFDINVYLVEENAHRAGNDVKRMATSFNVARMLARKRY